jgi:nucleoside-diphosphate-sugar epimerase
VKILISGASGYLGRRVTAAFLERGHQVRAIVRPACDVTALPWADEVELFRADLRGTANLERAFEGADALVHLAAAVEGDDQARFNGTAVGTQRLLDAMGRSNTRRLVLAGSFSVYDGRAAAHGLDEATPIETLPHLYERDGYAVAKWWQEHLVRRCSHRHGWDLTVLRPGFIWDAGNWQVAGLGLHAGPVHAIVGPMSRPPLTHVENCADCFVTVTEDSRSVGQTFNVVDGHGVRRLRFARDMRRITRTDGTRLLPVPYWLGLGAACFAAALSRLCFGPGGRLPGLFVPDRFRARFSPALCSPQKLADRLGWRPLLDYPACLKWGNE